jgi:hypothetical protein
MNNMRRLLIVCGLGVIGIACAILIIKNRSVKHSDGMCEEAGRGIDERLRESKAALDKASAHIQNVFEHVKNRKS